MKKLVASLSRHPNKYGYKFRFAFEGDRQSTTETYVDIGLVEFKAHRTSEILPSNHGIDVDDRDMQSLMDMLWDEGFRPTKMVVGKDEELFNAIQANLEDLRFILGSK